MSAIYPPDFSFHYSSNSEELNPIQLLGFGAEDAYLRHAERVWADASFTASRLAMGVYHLLRAEGTRP